MTEATDIRYHVRQYHPNYFSGCENAVIHDVPYEDILKAPWCENFIHDGFDRFTISPYGTEAKELIIVAHYKSGEHWVVGFAVDTTHPFADDWRYKSSWTQ